jgi:hypothetical protein
MPDRRGCAILSPLEARRHIAMVGTCLAALAAVSCGGGGGSASVPAVGADFATKAAAICQAAHAQKQAQGSFVDPDFNPTKPDPAKLPAVAAFIAQGTAIYSSWLHDMQALGSPPSGQDAWAAVLTAIDEQLRQHEHQRASALAGDTKAFTDDFEQGARSRADLQAAAKAAGLPACATVEG